MKKYLYPLVALSILGALPAMAQTTAVKPLAPTKEQIEAVRAAAQGSIKSVEKDLRSQKVGATAEAKAKIDAARTQLKNALAKIKDAKKKKAAENLNGKFSAFNKQTTDHFADVLGKLKLVLGRVEDRATKAEGRGVNVADVKTAIENARMAIAKADDAVKAEAAKIYTITVTNEKNLREDIKKTRQQLRDDLDATRNVVKDARDAVRKAAVALAKAEPKAEEQEKK